MMSREQLTLNESSAVSLRRSARIMMRRKELALNESLVPIQRSARILNQNSSNTENDTNQTNVSHRQDQIKITNFLLLNRANVASVTDFLTIIERVQLELTCKYLRNELLKSKYWRCVVINFDASYNFIKHAVFIWKLLCTRKAALKSVVITLGNQELDMISSLLTRCN